MKFTCIDGDQDKVFSFLNLASIINDGKRSTKTLLSNKDRFELTPIEIETIKNMQSLLEKCLWAFIWEIRVPSSEEMKTIN